MLRNSLLSILVLCCALQGAGAQVEVNIGPETAPIGCDILACVTNDTSSTLFIGSIGPIRVLDAFGTEVFSYLALLFVPIQVSPGEAIIHFRWDQIDNNGVQVPPGFYTVEVSVNGTLWSQGVTVGGVDAAMMSIGVLRPGNTRNLYLCSPQDPGLIYGYAASTSSNVGIPTCGGVIPLDIDFLFNFSIMPGNGVFLNPVGLLAGPASFAPGTTTAPAIAVPSDPALSGFSFTTAFFVVDVTASCPIVTISDTATLTIL